MGFTFASPMASYRSAIAFVTSTYGTLSALAMSADQRLYAPLPRSTRPSFQILRTVNPSTIGVAVLGLVALVPQPTLAALLAGVEAGLGAAALISLGRVDASLYVDPKSHAVYRR